MKRAMVVAAGCAFLLIGVAGCERQGTGDVLEPLMTPHSVTGDAWLVDNTSQTEVAVTLHVDDNGNTNGLLELYIVREGSGGIQENIETMQQITCATLEGNSAWIRSVVFKTSHPDNDLFKVGAEYVTLIRDIGTTRDIMHSISVEELQGKLGGQPVTCSNPPTIQLMETVVSKGDYQIR